jgi:hypothetical protein
MKNPLESSPKLLEDRIEFLTEMLEDNPTGSMAPIIATEIERLKELLEKFRKV